MQSGVKSEVRCRLVLVGAGHSHGIVLRRWRMNPVPGVQLIVISDGVQTPYSGMLPGHIAGWYGVEECHIDVRLLATAAGAMLVVDRAIGLDLVNRRVRCANRPAVGFDWLSIDIGSTPNTLMVPGAQDYAIPVKPISRFLRHWQAWLEELARSQPMPVRVGIVGGGVGGVELALAMRARLLSLWTELGRSREDLAIHVVQRGDRLVPDRPPRVGAAMESLLAEYGIQVHLQAEVMRVELAAGGFLLTCGSGLVIPCDRVFWVTQATAAPWLRESGLATDDQGFVLVNDRLQSVSDAGVFAAGDVATMVDHPRPKAGVFAVRQGRPLEQNLRCAVLGQRLRRFVPQRDFLTLVGTGDGRAIALRNGLVTPPSGVLWQWKDWIDRRFMATFQGLQPMGEGSSRGFFGRGRQNLDEAKDDLGHGETRLGVMHCAGCGSKVGSDVLGRTLARLRQDYPVEGDGADGGIVLGLDAPDDGAVLRVPPGRVLVQTVDHFRALVEDPFLLGQITGQHCLSDVFAMGAEAHSGLAMVTLPYGVPAYQEELLFPLLAGAVKALAQAGATLIGGHTTVGQEWLFGLACNGVADPQRLWQKSGLQPGQGLVLTKALGTGTLFAANMRLQAKGCWIEGALHSMLMSNRAAAEIFRGYGVTACTDVTGFGLLGHLWEMVWASGVAAVVEVEKLPVLEGAMATTRLGLLSSLHGQNYRVAGNCLISVAVRDHAYFPVLFDPQTSGGLLAGVPADQVAACVMALRAAGYEAAEIGQVVSSAPPHIEVR